MHTKEYLLKRIKPMLNTDEWKAYIELLRLEQRDQTQIAMTAVEPHEIHRAQGRVHAFDMILAIDKKARTA